MPDQFDDPFDHPHREEAAMPYPAQRTGGQRGGVEDALRRHESRLLAIEGVEGVARGRTREGKDAVLLYLRDASVRGRVPPEVDGYPVQTTVTGIIEAH